MGAGASPQGGGNNAMAEMMKKQQAQQEAMKKQMTVGMAGPQGGAAGGVAGGNNKVAEGPADLTSPQGAVQTFLKALEARDADRLSEATARRAATESVAKNQELFGKILDINLSDSDMDDLAKKLEGYQIASVNPAKSTGKIDVVIQKSGPGGARFTRKITARREKKGWGVLDIGPYTEFKGMGSRTGVKKR
jgi:hypothetical protein